MTNPYQLNEAKIIERTEESAGVFTLRLQFVDREVARAYRFHPGQFNMLYLYGVGEVPISIVSDPGEACILQHTIRVVGRVTEGMAHLQPGDFLGVRGPYGRGWPLADALGRDVLIVTGGLGCAPVVSVINYIQRRWVDYGQVTIMQGVKHADDLIWREQYAIWAQQPHTRVLLAADVKSSQWPWYVGPVTALFDQVAVDPSNSIAMMCGPQPMMNAAARRLVEMGLPEEEIWLSMERSMHCAVGHCGHCQYGPLFVCKDGPVFRYADLKPLLAQRGF